MEKAAEMTREQQTKWIVGAIIGVAALFLGWQEYTRDFSTMTPDERCGSMVFRWKFGWDTESECKAFAAAARMKGEPFSNTPSWK